MSETTGARPASAEAFFASLLARVGGHPALSHSFLRRFAEAELTREQLARFAGQHYLYSRLFTRNLAAVVSEVPDERARSMLIANMYEEIGEPKAVRDRAHLLLLKAGLVTPDDVGAACAVAAAAGSRGDVTQALLDAGKISWAELAAVVDVDSEQLTELTHPALFRRFLRALGIGPRELPRLEPIRETEAFIEEYRRVSRGADWLVSMGAMGPGTECVVPAMYRYIESGIQRSGVVAKVDYVFWTIHIQCDDGHGASIVAALEPHAKTLESQARIADGAMRVLDARAKWFDGLERLVFS